MLAANEIEVFLALEKTMSFTKAAELLHMSQPTISHRLKALEAEIGFSLFERRKGQKKIQLTPKGEEFISIANRWNALWQETHALQQSELQPNLSIGSVDSLSTTILSPLYRQLSIHMPKINLRIITKTSLEVYELVEKREIDVGFVLREMNSTSVIVEPMFSEPMVIIQPIGEALNKKIIHPAELDQCYEIFFNWSPAFMAWHNRWWHPHGSPYIEVDTISLITIHLTDSRHWAIVPMSMARSQPTASLFDTAELAIPAPNRVCYKITHRYPQASNVQALRILSQYLHILTNDNR
jgi:DNA-binding transcriptional LysR family regulator